MIFSFFYSFYYKSIGTFTLLAGLMQAEAIFLNLNLSSLEMESFLISNVDRLGKRPASKSEGQFFYNL